VKKIRAAAWIGVRQSADESVTEPSQPVRYSHQTDSNSYCRLDRIHSFTHHSASRRSRRITYTCVPAAAAAAGGGEARCYWYMQDEAG